MFCFWFNDLRGSNKVVEEGYLLLMCFGFVVNVFGVFFEEFFIFILFKRCWLSFVDIIVCLIVKCIKMVEYFGGLLLFILVCVDNEDKNMLCGFSKSFNFECVKDVI